MDGRDALSFVQHVEFEWFLSPANNVHADLRKWQHRRHRWPTLRRSTQVLAGSLQCGCPGGQQLPCRHSWLSSRRQRHREREHGFCASPFPTHYYLYIAHTTRILLTRGISQLIQQTMTQCPKTKLCVSGYSQGAQVAHNAANMISTAATNFINSVVLFGDPDNGSAFGKVPASKVSTDCHTGDDICLHGDLVLAPHLDYCLDVGTEASFAVGKSGL